VKSAGGTISQSPPDALNVQSLREQFPILSQTVHGKPLVYLDSAATSQKPQAVIDAISRYYIEYNANVHRGLHRLSELATTAYEQARNKVQRFLGATDAKEIIFTRGTTEAINLVASSWGRSNLKAGDEVLISHMEHHSNIVPWQLVCEQTGAILRVIPVNDRGELLMDKFAALLTDCTRIVSVVHISNALGTINPVKDIVRMAHEHGALVMIDGAQAAPHMAIDVRDIDCDFYAISGHKMFGPTGIGGLYGKSALLRNMPPYQGGGEMITNVTFENTLYADLSGFPHCFAYGGENGRGSA
jgi:cysteine desulfurase/selenocysteine lyase